MQTYQTGDSLIFKVPEREISLQPAALYPEAFPVAEAEAVIQPIALSIHSWVVQTPHDLIVIDTATGNGRERGGNPLYHQLNTPYLENLRAAGVNPEDVTLVLLTHLHTDHVGWNTVWQDDRWVPLFPNARYLCSAKELSRVKNSERYRALWLDSLLPVIEAGQLETVDVATRPRVGGVFSVQPSSPGGTVTDEQEVRYGITIADLAVECGVKHLVYSSGSATGETPTGVAHYDTKAEIERHIRRLPLAATIVRPATFMELLVMPGFGLDEGRFQFFMLPEGRMQVLAVEDIGHLVAAVFAAPARFAGKMFEIASDSVTGRQLELLFSAAAGRPIPYSRFSDEVLAASPFLHKLTGLVDDGRLAGHADLDALRQLHPQLHTFAGWLAGPGRPAFERALTSGARWAFDR